MQVAVVRELLRACSRLVNSSTSTTFINFVTNFRRTVICSVKRKAICATHLGTRSIICPFVVIVTKHREWCTLKLSLICRKNSLVSSIHTRQNLMYISVRSCWIRLMSAHSYTVLGLLSRDHSQDVSNQAQSEFAWLRSVLLAKCAVVNARLKLFHNRFRLKDEIIRRLLYSIYTLYLL